MKIRLILGLMVTALLAGHAPAAPQPELAGLPGNRIEEPVFGTEAMVYAGGVTGAPTVVLVHGIGQEAAAVWEGLIEALRPHYRVITFDLPGFGASSSGNHFYSPQAYAAFLDHVIGRYAEAPVLLAGHSLGGAVALHYAADRPERVQRLLLTSVAGILHRSAYAGYLIGQPASDGDGGMHVPDSPFARLAGKVIRKIDRKTPDLAQALSSRLARRALLGGEPERIAAVALGMTDFSSVLDAVEAPAWVYWGADDPIAPLRTARVLEALLPQASLTVAEGGGHLPMLEQPSNYQRWFLAALERDPPATDPAPPPERGRGVATCDGEEGMTLSGAYDRIRITGCRDVILDHVSAHRVDVSDSRVSMIAPRIAGSDVGLDVSRSDIVLTAGEIVGRTAILANGSRLDIAGTRLVGERAALRGVAGGATSELTLSVTPFSRGGRLHFLHTVRALAPGATL